jgi:hypothetical protein
MMRSREDPRAWPLAESVSLSEKCVLGLGQVRTVRVTASKRAAEDNPCVLNLGALSGVGP